MNEKPNIPSCMITIDREGNWLHERRPIIHEEIRALLSENLRRDEWGRYLISWRGQVCEVEVEDVPFLITRADLGLSAEGKQEVLVTLNDRKTEALNVSSLRINEGNVLYCTVKDGGFEARFSRPAYYQFSALLEFDEGKRVFFLPLNGDRIELPQLSGPE